VDEYRACERVDYIYFGWTPGDSNRRTGTTKVVNREVTVSASCHCFLVEFVGVAVGHQLKLARFGFLAGIHKNQH
jgi:hypothetical protein